MNISGPFLDSSRRRSPAKWYLSYFVPRRAEDGSVVLGPKGKPVMDRKRPHYESRAAAEADKPRILAEHHEAGASSFVRSRDAAAEYDQAKAIESRVSLVECARFYRQHHPQTIVRKVNEWVPLFLEDVKVRLGETRHWMDMKHRLGPTSRFARAFGTRIPETIERHETLTHLKSLDQEGRTTLNDKRAICNFFNWLLDQPGALKVNPAGGIKRRHLPRIASNQIRYLSLGHAERYLRAAERYDPELVAHEIVQLLAGVRADDEMANFDGAWVLPDTREVIIPAEHAKTGPRAVINELEDAFWAWWALYGRKGLLRPRNYPGRWNRLRALAAIDQRGRADELAVLPVKSLMKLEESRQALEAWPWNGRRRTFVTYHVAKHQSAAKTALIIRHRGDTYTLHNSYRGLGVSQSQGESYFNLKPAPVAEPIRPIVHATGIVRLQQNPAYRGRSRSR